MRKTAIAVIIISTAAIILSLAHLAARLEPTLAILIIAIFLLVAGLQVIQYLNDR